jgi:phosphoribosylanthranilate isomerase
MWIKICGVCDPQSAQYVAEVGADAIGLNFVGRSKRFVTVEQALSIANSVRGAVELVGVVEDLSLQQAAELQERVGLDRVQLHYSQLSFTNSQLPAWAYLAIGLTARDDVRPLDDRLGEMILVDACFDGNSGGTGARFDWNWVVDVASRRRIVLAGGLTPNNVQDAIALVGPYGVDVASGVEFPGKPGSKDPKLVRQFVRCARQAAAALRSSSTSQP